MWWGRLVVVAGVVVVGLAAGGWWWHAGRRATPPVVGPAAHVGSPACAGCHQDADQRWRQSHHALAMQPATEATVAGDFNGARFTYAGVTSTFARRDAKFVVRTDGPDGTLRDYEVAYTFGVSPLQQYLVPFPDGRLQALSIAWDTRPRAQGGQRWFHLYPGEKVTHRDELHWTRPSQNWNHMCAECHSTAVRKNYDATARRFATAYAEVSVGCEACHGPGSQHVAWARKERDWQRLKATKGLIVALDERRGGDVGDRYCDRQRATHAVGSTLTRARHLRPMPRAARSAHRRLRARPAARRHPSRRLAGGPSLPSRWSDPRRGLRVRLVPAVQDVRTRCDVLGLP